MPVGTISLTSPANTSTEISLTPQLEWMPDDMYSYYRVRVATDPDMMNIIYEASNPDEAVGIYLDGIERFGWTYSLTGPLLNGVTYYWQVTADDDIIYSNVFSFTTEAALPVADPSFSPSEGIFNNDQNVSLSCPTEGASIRYTTNGDEPTEESSLYTDPISVTQTLTIKAKAFKEGYTPSSVISALYTLEVLTPVIEPEAGTYSNDVEITLSCSTDAVEIRYTTNGDEPIESSSLYSAPFTISSTSTVKAKAFKTGYTPSSIESKNYTLVVVDPIITPSEDTYYNPINVSLLSDTIDALIYYTTNGDDPTEESALYTGEFSVSATTIIKAKAFKTNYTPSNVVLANYTILIAPPNISPPSYSGYFEPQEITISCETIGVEIRYTVDGNEPTEESTLYSVPFMIEGTQTIKAKAFKEGFASDTSSNSYIFVVKIPSSSPSTLLIYSAFVDVYLWGYTSTPGASAYYTLDGSEPTEESIFTLENVPFTITESTLVKVRAFKPGYTPSVILSASYTINLPNIITPVISPSGGVFEDITDPITLSCETTGSSIYYTINGDIPTEASTLYSSPFTLSATTTLKVKAFKAEYIDSSMAEAIFNISSAPVPSSDVITATYHGQNVSVIKMDGKGQSRYTAFVDASGNLKVDIDWLRPNSFPITLAISATP